MDPIIEARGLTRKYGDLVAVDRIDFAVGQGEIFGFLGPNGAGKSTTVRMLTGYLPPDGGYALIAGYDAHREPTLARSHIGVVPEEANVYADLSVWQNVMLMAELYGIGRARRTQRGGELLQEFGLAEKSRQRGRELSKGLRQRLMLCMALVSDPEILFLDEPTSGLDVASARLIREVVLRLNRERAMTVFLTTHNIDEADELCHRVAIINRGRLAAIDTPQALRAQIQSRRSVEVRFTDPSVDVLDFVDHGAPSEIVRHTDGFRLYSRAPGKLAQEIAARAEARGVAIEEICTKTPSLEEAFLDITSQRPVGKSHADVAAK
jgi:ABC-2 type transport system ATP-binding protein